MGTSVEIKIVSDFPKVDIDNILRQALNIFHKIAVKYSRFENHSELSILNRSNGKPIEVTAELFELVEFGLILSKETIGIFDITITDLLEAYGYTQKRDFSKLGTLHLAKEIQKILKSRASFNEILLDKKNLKITLKKDQKIDLSSYVKGFAILKAKNYILEEKIENFLINAGGDVYANGQNEKNKIWTSVLFDPNKNLHDLKKIVLRNEALACSGPWARKFKYFHHLINPKTGTPLMSSQTYAISNNPMIADVFATLGYLDFNSARKICPGYGVKLFA